MSASEYQIGGEHYKSEYQHWDWAIDIGLGYLESAATKYMSRWRDKNGPEDILKAIHYVEKTKEAFQENRYHNGSDGKYRDYYNDRFLSMNEIPEAEAEFIRLCSSWINEVNLDTAIVLAHVIHRTAVKAQEGQEGAGGYGRPTTGLKPASGQKTVAGGGAGRVNHPAPFGYTGEDG